MAERRLEIMLSRGYDALEEIRELTTRMDQLAAKYAATDPLGETGRRALFTELADLVDECLTVEKQAVGLLADMSG